MLRCKSCGSTNLKRNGRYGKLQRTICNDCGCSKLPIDTSPTPEGGRGIKIALLDIETAPNIGYHWGLWKQNISLGQLIQEGYMLCFAYKWVGEDKTHFVSKWEHGAQKMAQIAQDVISRADAIIGYNTKAFDRKHLNREIAKHGMSPPIPAKDIDLMLTVKSQFRLPSNKLDHVLDYFGFETKLKHAGFSMWAGVMDGDKAAQEEMKEYNIQDVEVMEPLYWFLLPWIKNHPDINLYQDGDGCCPNCGGRDLQELSVTAKTPALEYKAYRCNSCGTPLRSKSNIGIDPKVFKLTQDKT